MNHSTSEKLDIQSSSTTRDVDAERLAFVNDLPALSFSDLLPNHDGTSWFVKREGGPFKEVLFREGAGESRKLNVDEVVLLRSGSLLGDGSRYFRFNCEGQKVSLTPVHGAPEKAVRRLEGAEGPVVGSMAKAAGAEFGEGK
ncbi:hypothetical protein FBR05_05450 [Deltaproteobacteria bacterium PRO3]|nr:hypothetical protein [Deltaproteobacteria bacterium PRO3]